MSRDYEQSLSHISDFVTSPLVTQKLDRNEAQTRLHLINSIFFECLGWNLIDCKPEDSYSGTYTDYSFGKSETKLIVEAKKQGISFELPEGFSGRTCNLKTLFGKNLEIEKAVKQALSYCQTRGVPMGAVCNGDQLIGFIASRLDGIPPLEGKAIVFTSIADMQENFRELWDNFSAPGIENYHMMSSLKTSTALPPEKLSAHTLNYPGFKDRNTIQQELQLMGGLFLEDLNREPLLEEDFLKSCYCPSGALSQYALVGKEILEARYSSLFQKEIEVSTADISNKKGTTQHLTEDIVAAALSRRPIILLGEVGAGKSMFIRHFIKIEAADTFKRALVLYIDFGKEPALAEDLKQYVFTSCKKQLQENYGVNIENRNFVCGVYGRDLENFRNNGIYSGMRTTNPAGFELKEIEYLDKKLQDGPEHLRSCLEHISKGQGRQIVVFLDNIDQRPQAFQEEVFLIGNALAQAWPGTVFISLRPDVFYYSIKKGSLTGYQPRVFTISPPRVDRVLLKRLEYASRTLERKGALENFPQGVSLRSDRLSTYINIIHDSFSKNDELVEFIDNASAGNIRQALGFLTSFIGSGHVDTEKILSINEEGGHYIIALHEFFRAVIFGDSIYYDPQSSPIANIFDISSPDGREHFLLIFILMQIDRLGKKSSQQGYVFARDIQQYAQDLGFQPLQIRASLAHGLEKKLLESNPKYYAKEEEILHYRITTTGAYAIKKMIGFFAYIDAALIDTPITDVSFREKMDDDWTLAGRLKRVAIFCDYLDAQWDQLSTECKNLYNWHAVTHSLRMEILNIKSKSDRFDSSR